MKVRIYSPFLPYPVTEGAYRVIFDQAYSLLALGHDVELVTWKNSFEEFERRSSLWKSRGKAREQVSNGHRQSEHNSGPGYPNHGRENEKYPTPDFIYLGPVQDCRTFRILYSCWRGRASPESFYYPTSVLDQLEGLPPCDLAIYHYSFAHLWLRNHKSLPQEKRRAVHFHNLESDLSALQFQNSNGIKKWIHHSNSTKLKLHEAELMQLSHELWFLSPMDLADFQLRLGSGSNSKISAIPTNGTTPSCAFKALLRLIPPTFSSEISLWTPRVPPVRNNPVLGFIGGFDFQPNIDSVQWILKSLVPALEKAGFRGKIKIAGRRAQAVIQPHVRSQLVEVLPDNFDTDRFFAELSWMLVPHLTGSGVRIKLLDALSRKIPVMATRSAVERLHPEIQNSPLLFTSDDPCLWAKRAMRETVSETRSKYQNLDFPLAMIGTEIYRNV